MATIAATANTPIVTNDLIRSSRRISCETSSRAGRDEHREHTVREQAHPVRIGLSRGHG
jgi:hypothetical protein